MRIDGSLSLHAARAYGVSPGHAAGTSRLPAPDGTGAIAPTQAASRTGTRDVHAIVGGRVPGGVEFERPSIPAAALQGLSLYTRAADRVEAATGISLGRSLDVRG
ncbi:MAG: hypothetical protein KF817_11120 [Phycisphaeraceae bacterium]|nr:hypothetical protein [Phycisphaeraceae bacterium]